MVKGCSLHYKETIRIRGVPFQEGLPLPSSEFINVFSNNGLLFIDEGNSIQLYENYDCKRIDVVRNIVDDSKWAVDVRHSIWTFYDDCDYLESPLWDLVFPEIWIDELDFENQCSECNVKRIFIDTSIKINGFKCNHAICVVNGQFIIVRNDLRLAIESSLSGARFSPFDFDEAFYYLEGTSALKNIIIRNDEVINFNGICNKCSFPKYDMFFGPLRYKKDEWDGKDIVHATYLDGLLFSKHAYNLMKTFEKNIEKDGVAFLEV